MVSCRLKVKSIYTINPKDNRMAILNIVNKQTNKQKTREFSTHKSWKEAVKKLDKSATFVGDKDIDGSFSKGEYDAEWDGAAGEIRFF